MSQDLGLREVGEDDFDFQDVDLDPLQDESDENTNDSEKAEEAEEDLEKPKEEEVFEVETILDRKLASNGELLYYVKWVSMINRRGVAGHVLQIPVNSV